MDQIKIEDCAKTCFSYRYDGDVVQLNSYQVFFMAQIKIIDFVKSRFSYTYDGDVVQLNRYQVCFFFYGSDRNFKLC